MTNYETINQNHMIVLNGKEIEKIEEYNYLGNIVSMRNRMDKEIRERKKKAWRTYRALKQVFKGKMEVRSKIKILEACIYPVLTNGAQAWTLTKNQGRSLQATGSMERSILHIKKGEKISNEVIRKRTVRKLKIKFAGHVARHGKKMDEENSRMDAI